MAGETYFHVGIFVYDIQEAIERYSKTLGLSFVDPIMYGIPHLVDQGRKASLVLPLAYATQGPPYFELLEMTGEDGLYGRQNGEGINHLGLWDPDIEGTVARLEDQGIQPRSSPVHARGQVRRRLLPARRPSCRPDRARGRRPAGHDGGVDSRRRFRGLPRDRLTRPAVVPTRKLNPGQSRRSSFA